MSKTDRNNQKQSGTNLRFKNPDGSDMSQEQIKEAKKVHWLKKKEQKLKDAESDDTLVLSIKSPEVGLLGELLRATDSLLLKVRSQAFARGSRISMETAIDIIQTVEQAQDLINTANKKAARVIGYTYVAPYNYRRALNSVQKTDSKGTSPKPKVTSIETAKNAKTAAPATEKAAAKSSQTAPLSANA